MKKDIIMLTVGFCVSAYTRAELPIIGGMCMKIDVSGLMNRRTDVIRFDYTFDPAHTDAECVLLPCNASAYRRWGNPEISHRCG